jgi:hypothetical protein
MPGLRCGHRWRSRLAWLTVLVATAQLALWPAGAQASFKVFPTLIDLKRDPGQATIGTFSVRLNREQGRRFRVSVEDVVQQANGSYAYAKPSRSPFSASTWVSAAPHVFSGGPDRAQPIEYRVLVPRGAEPGDHVTALAVQRLPEDRNATAGVIEAIAIQLDVRVSGVAKPDAQITSLSAPSVAGSSLVTVSASIRNTGNVRLDFDHRNKGSLAILGGSDRKANLKFGGLLYPDQSRAFDLSWDSPPLFGRFKASASVDTGRRVVSQSRSILVVPWRQLLALVLVGLAVVVLTIGLRRRRRGAG